MKLEKINSQIRAKKDLNQWTSNVQPKRWFRNMKNIKSMSFVVFDIKSYYPSISPRLLEDALSWGSSIVKIPERDKELFRESRRCLLFHNLEYWTKIKNPSFDVPMGSFDGAEVAELCGLYLLEKLIEAKIGLTRACTGLYRDDGLALTQARNRTGQKMVEKIRDFFKSHGLKLSKCEHGLKSVDFLDLTFHIDTHTYEPYRKDDNPPTYIHKQSNHPPAITKNIPGMIQRMISANSSNEEIFNRHKGIYEEALRKSGYKSKMIYVPQDDKGPRRKKVRYPLQFYWNPPYNRRVKTPVGKLFGIALDKCYPRGSEWYHLFNRHTVKLSYSCTKNVASKISQHNHKVLKGRKNTKAAGCKCRNKEECPIPNDCEARNIVYQALVESEGRTYNYFGLTSRTFKERYGEHKSDIKHEKGEKEGTALSSKIWQLKKTNKEYSIKWAIVDRPFPYHAGARFCDLCSSERMYIALGEKGPWKLPPGCVPLNRRSEILGKCRHKARFSLARVVEPQEE